jgi:hypothetical protein
MPRVAETMLRHPSEGESYAAYLTPPVASRRHPPIALLCRFAPTPKRAMGSPPREVRMPGGWLRCNAGLQEVFYFEQSHDLVLPQAAYSLLGVFSPRARDQDVFLAFA